MTTSRYKVLPRPIRVPGTCKFCGTSKGPVIDTLVEIDFEGSLYVCVKCAKEIGRTAGLVDPTPVKEDSEESGNDVTERDLNELLDSINLAIGNFISNTGLQRNLPEDSEAGSGDSEEPAGGTKKGAGTSRRKRPDGVSDDTSDGTATDDGGAESDLFGL